MNAAKKIFIVDDDEDDRFLLKDAVFNVIKGIEIIEACDGIELLSLLEAEGNLENCVILMDMNMPRMSGLEALSAIKAEEHLLHIPVIMISTTNNTDLIATAYAKGINAFISKPYQISEYEQLADAISVCFLRIPTSRTKAHQIKNMASKSILVIEDNPDQRILMSLALRSCMPQVKVISLADENMALEHLESQWARLSETPRLILLDLYLPDRQNGLRILENLKKFLAGCRLMSIPVIVLSHSDNPVDIRECYRSQANAYLVKSDDLTTWFSFFSNLCHFWINTISSQNKLLR
ncbi:response regulator [Dyadobacter psychrotolerans]|uniref:Response regulator n=1 Tax=Dyadobacter psychrotolerans TaxID=2541721 RepID=A0A4R5DKZ0_9BACT|nr:response regulator [Dyadobacter psychrotolerans]TDE14866.1 response regulator [Dyadobacter psychrotolerans]